MKSIIIISLWMITGLCNAATYYISASGNDSNLGTSPAIPWATLNSAYNHRGLWSPGDSILLNKGDTFYGMMWITGTSSNILVSTYGTGANPILIGDEPNVVWTNVTGHVGVYAAPSSFPSEVVKVADVNGVLYGKINQGALDLNTWLNSFTNGSWGFSLNTPTLVYIRTLNDLSPIQMRLFDFACVQISLSGCTVENMDIRRSYSGIVGGPPGVIIRNNSVQDSFFMAINTSHPFNNQIYNNTIARSGWTSIYLNSGGSNWVHHNTITLTTNNILGIAVNGAELCGVGLQQGTNNLVEHNSFYSCVQCAVDFFLENSSVIRYNYAQDMGSAGSPDGTGLQYYGNIFNRMSNGIAGGHDWTTNSPSPDAGTNQIFNNVFYNFKTLYGFFSTAGTGTRVRNNIFVSANTTPANLVLITSPGVDLDYNLYSCSAGTARGWFYNGVLYTTLAAFRTASGLEPHGIYVDNTNFVTIPPLVPLDFYLKSNSPAIDAGTIIAPGLVDYQGTPIPKGSAPDIGPFEYIPTGSTNVVIAASCSQADIQTAIAACLPGGTVIVPAGTCAPTISILLTNQITLSAQGTILQDSIINTGDGAASSIIQVVCPPTAQFVTRVTGFTFQTGARATKLFDSGNIHLGGGGSLVRIDHCNFTAANNIGIGGGDVFGVIDHCVFSPPGAFTQPMKLTHQTYGGALNGYGAWALPGWTNSYQEDASAIYIEDNNFTNSSGAPGIGIDGFGGARWVTRHNIFDRQIDGGHGTETTAQFAGCRLKDSYNNLFIEHGDSECGHWRSGSGVWVSNTIVSSTSGYTCRNYRMAFGGFYKYANGTNSWDNNDPVIYGTGTATAGGTLAMTDSTKAWAVNQWQGYSIRNVNTERCSLVSGNTATTVSYIPSTDDPAGNTVFSPGQVYQFRKVITVLDEVGRGQGALRNNTVPAWPNQVVDPVWQWSNTLNGGAVTMNNGGYYSSVVGQEIRNEVNLSWVPYFYPHPLITGTNPPPGNPPSIVQQPRSTNVYSSQSALFTIAATGTAPLTYRWTTNGVAAGTNGPALSVGPCPVAWSGMTIVCVITNTIGAATSATATLTVLPDPVITGQPSNRTVGVGSTANFSVTATGQTTLSYQWSKNGSVIGGATLSTYTTPSTVNGDNNSQFTVVVTDSAGSLQSATATLTVVPLPVITSQPVSTNIFATQTALFSLTANGGTLHYQWKTNGVSTGTNGPALTVGPAPVAWSGMTVVCVVTNLAGSVTSSTATLTVSPDPAIGTQPANSTVGVGDVASFSVTATGQSTLQYQWKKNGSVIGGATASLYNTPAVVAGDNGAQFLVIVTDTAGSLTSANATLTVTNIPAGPDPIITRQPQSTNIFNNQTASFGITASGATTLHYQWSTNGVNTGTDSSTLALGTCPIAWNGLTVVCVVSDVAGSVTSSVATLTILADPVISSQPSNTTTLTGNTANFTVTATGQTALSYQWKKNGSTIGGATQSSYTTPATVIGDNGSTFLVIVTDSAGSLQSANATLTVTNAPAPPVITSQPQSTNIFAAQSAIFQLTAQGPGTLSYQWNTNTVDTGTNGPVLAVGPCPVEWNGMAVLCVVSSAFGSVTSSIATLTVGADPVIISQPQGISVFTGGNATFRVTATGQTALTYQWSRNGSNIGGATSSMYVTPALTLANNGDSYFVDVTDNAGTLRSATATLTVLSSPTKIAHGHIVKVKVGTTGP